MDSVKKVKLIKCIVLNIICFIPFAAIIFWINSKASLENYGIRFVSSFIVSVLWFITTRKFVDRRFFPKKK